MASIVVAGDTSGSVTIAAPAIAGTPTLTLPTASGTILTSATPFSNGQGPAFSAWQSSSQTLSSSVTTLMQFQTKEFDTATCFNNTNGTVTLNGLSVPAYAFCPNVAGYYQFTFNVYMGIQPSSQQAVFYKNGSASKFATGTSSSTIVNGINNTALIYLNGTGDYVQAYLNIGTGQALQNASTTTYFQATMVRAA